MKQMAIWISTILISVMHLSTAAQAATPPGFDPNAWNQLVNRAQTQGATKELSNGAVYKSLSRMMPGDPTQAHRSEYFSDVGGLDAIGNYQIAHVEIVSENWRINKLGDWDIDQWVFVVGADGNLTRASHIRLVEKMDGEVLVDDLLPATDDECLQALGTRLREWFQATLPAPSSQPKITLPIT